MKTKLLIGAVSIFFLSACGEEVKSRDWWEAHPEEAVKKWKECMESGEESVNCINVKQAAKYINTPEMKKLHEERAAKIRKQMGL
ncbi:EexN family lipoprotein [Providencia alcalifaciens]|jgi:hypothetical protein|uniref:EexN family lipoprotein n=1 Tax=Providencia alcalifaciens TaxID=126385 RepID=UPI0012CCA32B|nr:EexN family lipoprotein [Providencia alcalifaciens]EBW1331139.1 hypothetical protein [Salmonella enterica subsp. enterica serovar Enteritidis]ECH8679217.1 hypothetical protein [Salmonella enterica subsp. enterica serovar Agona]WGZ56400.1 EexN family lipoprotein [Providencia alcalifaciens]WGZ56434.1 EexN family lipoprotein [Providencia alcalifaciens]CAG9437363.1 hypothetical protein NVI2019_KOLGMIGM_04201 [Providencia alcalifaciens]